MAWGYIKIRFSGKAFLLGGNSGTNREDTAPIPIPSKLIQSFSNTVNLNTSHEEIMEETEHSKSAGQKIFPS